MEKTLTDLMRAVTLDRVAIGLAVIMAAIAWYQSSLTKAQLELLKRADERATNADVHISISSRRVHDSKFFGVSLTNRSHFDVVILGWILEVEQKAGADGVTFSHTPIVREFEGVELTTLRFPHRMRRGDTESLLLYEAQILNALRHDDGKAARFRVWFQDTFGNAYRMPDWLEVRQGGNLTVHENPAWGYVSVSDIVGPGYFGRLVVSHTELDEE